MGTKNQLCNNLLHNWRSKFFYLQLWQNQLRGYSNAIGVSDYHISRAVPEELKSQLPEIADIENELKTVGGGIVLCDIF